MASRSSWSASGVSSVLACLTWCPPTFSAALLALTHSQFGLAKRKLKPNQLLLCWIAGILPLNRQQLSIFQSDHVWPCQARSRHRRIMTSAEVGN